VSDLARVAAALGAASSVAVLAHIKPEGDAIGSTLAATLALRAAGKRTAAFNADPMPPDLLELPGAGECSGRCLGRLRGCLVVDTATGPDDLLTDGGRNAGCQRVCKHAVRRYELGQAGLLGRKWSFV
jgi:hypothetical protein